MFKTLHTQQYMLFFDYFFSVNIKEKNQFKGKKMHKIESIQQEKKLLEHLIVLAKV